MAAYLLDGIGNTRLQARATAGIGCGRSKDFFGEKSCTKTDTVVHSQIDVKVCL